MNQNKKTLLRIKDNKNILKKSLRPFVSQLDPSASKEFMGWVVAANPFGQMLFSPLFGWWVNKRGSVRLPLILSLVLFTLASALYSVLEIIPAYPTAWMVIARFLVGVSSGNFAQKLDFGKKVDK